MLSRLQCTFSLNQNNVNDYIKPCMAILASLNCIRGIMLCLTIALGLAMPLRVRNCTRGLMEDESSNLPCDGIFSVFAEQNLLIDYNRYSYRVFLLRKTVVTRLS